MGKSIFVAMLPVILIAGAIIGYLYYYKVSVNRRLKGEATGDRMISPANLGILLLSFFLITSNVRNNAAISTLQNQLNYMNSQLNSISQELDNIGRDHSHDFSWSMEIKELFRENDHYLARVQVLAEPAVIDDQTRISLHVDGQDVEMQPEHHQFNGEFIMKTNDFPQTCYIYYENKDGGVREDLYFEPEKLFTDMFPNLMITGGTTISSSTLNADFYVELVRDATTQLYFSSAEVVITDRNEIIHTQKLEYNKDNAIKFNGKISGEENVRIYINAEDVRGWKYHYSWFSGTGNGASDQDLCWLTVADETGLIVVSY